MKTKIFENGWYILGAIMITAILDLIALPGYTFGAGFVFGFIYFIALGYNKIRQ
jgi:hypothetical protein